MVIKIAGSPIETSHTNRFNPWKRITYFALKDKFSALLFEKYFKSPDQAKKCKSNQTEKNRYQELCIEITFKNP